MFEFIKNLFSYEEGEKEVRKHVIPALRSLGWACKRLAWDKLDPNSIEEGGEHAQSAGNKVIPPKFLKEVMFVLRTYYPYMNKESQALVLSLLRREHFLHEKGMQTDAAVEVLPKIKYLLEEGRKLT